MDMAKPPPLPLAAHSPAREFASGGLTARGDGSRTARGAVTSRSGFTSSRAGGAASARTSSGGDGSKSARLPSSRTSWLYASPPPASPKVPHGYTKRPLERPFEPGWGDSRQSGKRLDGWQTARYGSVDTSDPRPPTYSRPAPSRRSRLLPIPVRFDGGKWEISEREEAHMATKAPERQYLTLTPAQAFECRSRSTSAATSLSGSLVSTPRSCANDEDESPRALVSLASDGASGRKAAEIAHGRLQTQHQRSGGGSTSKRERDSRRAAEALTDNEAIAEAARAVLIGAHPSAEPVSTVPSPIEPITVRVVIRPIEEGGIGSEETRVRLRIVVPSPSRSKDRTRRHRARSRPIMDLSTHVPSSGPPHKAVLAASATLPPPAVLPPPATPPPPTSPLGSARSAADAQVADDRSSDDDLEFLYDETETDDFYIDFRTISLGRSMQAAASRVAELESQHNEIRAHAHAQLQEGHQELRVHLARLRPLGHALANAGVIGGADENAPTNLTRVRLARSHLAKLNPLRCELKQAKEKAACARWHLLAHGVDLKDRAVNTLARINLPGLPDSDDDEGYVGGHGDEGEGSAHVDGAAADGSSRPNRRHPFETHRVRDLSSTLQSAHDEDVEAAELREHLLELKMQRQIANGVVVVDDTGRGGAGDDRTSVEELSQVGGLKLAPLASAAGEVEEELDADVMEMETPRVYLRGEGRYVTRAALMEFVRVGDGPRGLQHALLVNGHAGEGMSEGMGEAIGYIGTSDESTLSAGMRAWRRGESARLQTWHHLTQHWLEGPRAFLEGAATTMSIQAQDGAAIPNLPGQLQRLELEGLAAVIEHVLNLARAGQVWSAEMVAKVSDTLRKSAEAFDRARVTHALALAAPDGTADASSTAKRPDTADGAKEERVPERMGEEEEISDVESIDGDEFRWMEGERPPADAGEDEVGKWVGVPPLVMKDMKDMRPSFDQ